MRSGLFLIAAGLFILGIGLGIGIDRHWLDKGESATQLPDGETAIEHARKHLDPEYVCPMHADVVSKEAGSCPICGMDLVLREVDPGMVDEDNDMPVVTVPPEFIHNFGVRTATVTRGHVSRRIESIGRVARMVQPRLTEVPPGLAGKLLWLSEKQVGDSVHKGDRLYTLDAPEWQRLQQLYLDALSEEDQQHATQLRQRLRTLGMSADGLARLQDSGNIEQTLNVVAPQSGTIVEWLAMVGDSIDSATNAVTLGGMNRIPVVVTIFEGQGGWIRRGQRAVFRVPTLPGSAFEGQVDRPDREINFSNRTQTIYTGFSTTDPRIRYGMLVEVEIETSARQNVLRVPREALIQTGSGNRVIVARGAGRFQAVAVETGLMSDTHAEILSGLEEEQEVVVSGQFLIDSESSLNAGFRRMEAQDNDL